MKITIVATGKEKDFAGKELVSDYLSRVSHYYPVDMLYVGGADQKEEQEKVCRTIEKIGNSVYLVVLDEYGKPASSKELASLFDKVTNMSKKDLVFVIGGAYGVGEEIKNKADVVVSLSKMTFTHQMVRLIIAEQIYRACTIQKGEKYHHE